MRDGDSAAASFDDHPAHPDGIPFIVVIVEPAGAEVLETSRRAALTGSERADLIDRRAIGVDVDRI
jgi:hypothetical protein